MKYKPDNVKLLITHDDDDECSVVSGEQIECLFHRVSKTKEASKKPKPKSSRCKDTIDWVEVEYGDEYKKPKKEGKRNE